MQPHAPRPSLQPIQRSMGGVVPPTRSMRIPARGAGQYTNPVDRAMMHNFDTAPHYTPQTPPHTPTYASSTQAMFAAPVQAATPYEQMYHYNSVKGKRTTRFPFRAFMIVLVIGALSFGAYAAYRAFTTPSPVNAEPPYTAHTDPTLTP